MSSRKLRRTFSLLALCCLALPLLSACGGGAAKEITATLKTFNIGLSSSTAKAGDVTFHLKNAATDITHEFVVVKTDTAAGKLPLGGDGKKVSEDGIEVVDEMEDIEVGKGGDLTVNLTPGHYVLMCNIEDHYKAGMHADLTVVP